MDNIFLHGRGLGHCKTFSKARALLYTDPVFAETLLDMITQSTISYLKAQIKAGADMVQLFDNWAGILPPDHYTQYSLRYIQQICDAITEVPITVFAKGAFFAREQMGKLNCETVGLDWNMGIAESRKMIGDHKTPRKLRSSSALWYYTRDPSSYS